MINLEYFAVYRIFEYLFIGWVDSAIFILRFTYDCIYNTLEFALEFLEFECSDILINQA